MPDQLGTHEQCPNSGRGDIESRHDLVDGHAHFHDKTGIPANRRCPFVQIVSRLHFDKWHIPELLQRDGRYGLVQKFSADDILPGNAVSPQLLIDWIAAGDCQDDMFHLVKNISDLFILFQSGFKDQVEPSLDQAFLQFFDIAFCQVTLDARIDTIEIPTEKT